MDMRNVYVLGVPVKASMFKSRGPGAVATGVRECWRRRASGLAYVGACAVATARARATRSTEFPGVSTGASKVPEATMYHSFPGGRRAVARRTSSDRLEGAWLSFIEAQIRFLPSILRFFCTTSHIPS